MNIHAKIQKLTSNAVNLIIVKLSNFTLYFCILITVIVIVFNYTFVIAFLGKYHLLDKTGHFLGFLMLTWLIDKYLNIELKTLVITLIIYSALTELGQTYLGFRSGQWFDFVADATGCLCYALIIKANQKKQSLQS